MLVQCEPTHRLHTFKEQIRKDGEESRLRITKNDHMLPLMQKCIFFVCCIYMHLY